MKRIHIILLLISAGLLSSCEEEITVDTSEVEPSIVVDAFIDNLPVNQIINITLSREFYDDTPYDGVELVDAVYIDNITDPSEPRYIFTQQDETTYVWERPTETDSFGIVGDTYQLTVEIGNLTLSSTSTLNPVPIVDSIRFNYEDGSGFIDEGFDAEFFATDLEGIGNTYWIKGFKNGIFLDQPEYITTSFDGSFSQSDEDGILFIPPLRSAISPFEENDSGNGIAAPFLVGDSSSVELHSVTEEAFIYLNEIRTQTDRQGGISELFSVPVTNLTGNISTTGDTRVLGFFSLSSVSVAGLTLTQELADEAIEKDN